MDDDNNDLVWIDPNMRDTLFVTPARAIDCVDRACGTHREEDLLLSPGATRETVAGDTDTANMFCRESKRDIWEIRPCWDTERARRGCGCGLGCGAD